MIMHYYGGGIGHLNNTPPRQADPLDSNSDEMDVEEDEEDDRDFDSRMDRYCERVERTYGGSFD